MDFTARSGNPVNVRTACAVVGVYEDTTLTETAKALDVAAGRHLTSVLRQGDLKGKVGQSLLLHAVPGIRAQRVLLAGLGKAGGLDDAKFIALLQHLSTRLGATNARSALLCLLEVTVKGRDAEWMVRKTVEIFEYQSYRFTDMKSSNKRPQRTLTNVALLAPSRKEQEAVKRTAAAAGAIAKGVALARQLGNLPANVCTPAYLADEARKLGRAYRKISTRVIEEAQMKRLGMGAFLSVTAGSDNPAKLVICNYQGAAKEVKPHVLVGKGICFDSGGLSLKPAGAMTDMFYDMCGAASVLGVMVAAAEMALPLNIVGVLAAAENMPSGKATRPGDVVKTMSGQTVEISNTDAEGRLVLCDALTYIRRFKPATVVDIATLTGACITALGHQASGLFANDDELATALTGAGESTGDRVWRLPIWEEYQAQLASASADMNNTGGRAAGSITAACFLARYTKSYRWAHLDVAGTAFRGSGAARTATGRPVNLLCQYLMDRASRK